MKLTQFQVDAFTAEVFKGNPAAVVLLTQPLAEQTLQDIAAENNLSETAYLLPEGKGYNLRWFTPGKEVDLCGHATLASAHVLFTQGLVCDESVEFYTASGTLTVTRTKCGYEMDFPARLGTASDVPEEVLERLPGKPLSCETYADHLLIELSREDVLNFSGTFYDLPRNGLTILTARDDQENDFISRVFCTEQLGIDEDPVTGSAHCQLAPFWAKGLAKPLLKAYQASRRGGHLECEVMGDRVKLRGEAVTFMKAELLIENP